VKSRDRTSMGGDKEGFETTQWTELLRARTDDVARHREALGNILGNYWKPVYCCLRRKGFDNEEAKDLTQGFFHEIVLGRGLVQQADQAKGKFRTFLLTALDRYVTSAYRSETAKKRRPKDGVISLEGIESFSMPEPICDGTPDAAFHYAWASALLKGVIEEVRQECCKSGKATHWEVFQATVLAPIMEGAEVPTLADLCRKHGIAGETRASNMTITVKRCFQSVLRRHVRQFVDSESEVDGEIRDLMKILSRTGAGC